jgi:hypothetical protein
MSTQLSPFVVTATGTVVADSVRISGFTFTNKSASPGEVTFYDLDSDGSLGNRRFSLTVPTSGEVTHTYNGLSGIKCYNGVYVSVATDVVGFVTYI